MDEKKFEQEPMWVARSVILELLSETPIFVANDAKGMVQVDDFTPLEEDYPCKTARGVIDVYLRRHFYIIFANASKSVIKSSEHQRVETKSPHLLKSPSLNRTCILVNHSRSAPKNRLMKSTISKNAPASNKYINASRSNKNDEERVNNDWRDEVTITDV